MKWSYKLLFTIIILFFTCSLTFSKPNYKDTSKHFSNEISVDIANILTFLKKSPQSYMLNYKRNFSIPISIRYGLNLDILSFKEKNIYLNTRLGLEYNRFYNKSCLFFGFDFSFLYSQLNSEAYKNFKYGIEPLIGYKIYITEQISLSTELKINFIYYYAYKPSSFNTENVITNKQIYLGSIGMVLLNYHF